MPVISLVGGKVDDGRCAAPQSAEKTKAREQTSLQHFLPCTHLAGLRRAPILVVRHDDLPFEAFSRLRLGSAATESRGDTFQAGIVTVKRVPVPRWLCTWISPSWASIAAFV